MNNREEAQMPSAAIPPPALAEPPDASTRPWHRKGVWLAILAVVIVVSILSNMLFASVTRAPEADSAQTALTPPVSSTQGGFAAELTTTDVDTWLDEFMPNALASSEIAGATVVVVNDGEVVTQRGFGVSDVAAGTPVDPERTLFRIASISKPFTWTALMQLVEQGQVDLDADIATYLDFEIPARDDGPITVRDLMTHTSGFEEQVKHLIGTPDDPPPAYRDILSEWVPERIFAAGTTPAYSNYGAGLAGLIVERVSGEPYDEYVQRHIFDPLAMDRSSAAQPLPASLADSLSTGYLEASGDPVPFEMVGMAPAGSLSATGADMAQFMLAHLQDGQVDGGQILQPQTIEQMHTPQTDIDNAIPGLNRMALGMYESNINGRPVLAHAGDTAAFHTDMHLFTEDDTGLYVALNSAGTNGAAQHIRDGLFEGFADRYLPGETDGADTSRVDSETAAEHAAMLAGSYSSSRGSESNFLSVAGLLGTQWTVSADGDGGIVVPGLPGPDGQPRTWVETEPFVWQDVDSHQRLAAVVEDGQVVRFSVDLLSAITIFEPAPWYRASALVVPLLAAAVAVLALTALAWPVGAVVRRRHGRKLPAEGSTRLAHRLTRLSALAISLVTAAWAGLVVWLVTSVTGFGADIDVLLLTLQVVGLIALVGGTAVMLWNLWVVWRGPRRWVERILSIPLVLAAVTVLVTSTTFGLLNVGTQY